MWKRAESSEMIDKKISGGMSSIVSLTSCESNTRHTVVNRDSTPQRVIKMKPIITPVALPGPLSHCRIVTQRLGVYSREREMKCSSHNSEAVMETTQKYIFVALALNSELLRVKCQRKGGRGGGLSLGRATPSSEPAPDIVTVPVLACFQFPLVNQGFNLCRPCFPMKRGP